MFGKKVGGKRFFNLTLNGNTYELVDPDDFLIKKFTMQPRYYPRNWVKLFTDNLVGSMGSGKSTAINKIINIIHQIYGNELRAIRTNDPIYAIENALDESYFQILIIDDAVSAGMDSRRSMSNDNISLSQQYFLARHLAKKKMGEGILFVIFAVQSPTRLDKSIRENCDVTIYKNYYSFLNKILDPDSIKFIKDLTQQGLLENDFDQLSACLGVDRTDRPIQFLFPMEKPEIPIIECMKQPPNYDDLLDAIRDVYDDEMKEKVLKSFIYNYIQENEIEISESSINNLIMQVIYEYNFGRSDTPKPKINYGDVIIQNEICGMKWDDLSRKYNIPRTTLYDNCMKYKARLMQIGNA